MLTRSKSKVEEKKDESKEDERKMTVQESEDYRQIKDFFGTQMEMTKEEFAGLPLNNRKTIVNYLIARHPDIRIDPKIKPTEYNKIYGALLSKGLTKAQIKKI